MKCHLYWEHNGGDTLLYSTDFLGAYTRGASLEIALNKMPGELRSFLTWSGQQSVETITTEVSEEKTSGLNICDADSDAIFQCEREPLSQKEYEFLKILALRSAADFLALYHAIPDRNITCLSA